MIFCVPVRNLHLIDMEDFYQKNFQKILKKKNFGFFFQRKKGEYVAMYKYKVTLESLSLLKKHDY